MLPLVGFQDYAKPPLPQVVAIGTHNSSNYHRGTPIKLR